MNNEEKVRMGQEAERLLKNTLLADCFEKIKFDEFRKIENSSSVEEREQAFYMISALKSLQKELRRLLSDKEVIKRR